MSERGDASGANSASGTNSASGGTRGDTDLQVTRSLHVELYYHVLCHLDLGRDAASLHRRDRPERPWLDPLTRDYLAAPGRLDVQVLPLHVADLAALRRRLGENRPGSLRDGAGRRLGRSLLAALDAEHDAVAARYREAADRDRARITEVAGFLRRRLVPLRAALWAKLGHPPPLDVIHAGSLGDGRFSHGRAVTRARRRVVAVSLDATVEQVLCQVLHEEIHPVTDPAVLTALAAPAPSTDAAHPANPTESPRSPDLRDTRVGTPGYRVHREVENLAIATGQALIEQHAPDLLPAYRTWRQRHGR